MGGRDDMTCGELHDVAAELALGALSGRERSAALAHLEKCRACREDVRQLTAAGGAAGRGAPAPPDHPSAPAVTLVSGFENSGGGNWGRPVDAVPGPDGAVRERRQ